MNQASLCGYRYDEKAINSFLDRGLGTMLADGPPPVSGKGMETFIWEIEQALTGAVRPPHNQKIGDCVSHGSSGAAEDLQFVQMLVDPSLKFMPISSEVMYSLARVQIGQGGCGWGDGAVVAWAFEAMQKYGLLARGKYGNIDLTNYDARLAHDWGAPRAGCPSDLAELAKAHLVIKCQLLQASRSGPSLYEQARDVIVNKGLIVTGSNQLYSMSRDQDGFCGRDGHGGHCTYYRGVSDNSKRAGIVYQQSWGPQVPSQGAQQITLPSGRTITLPPGAFFIDADNFDYMHSGGDSEVWALTAEVGWIAPDSEQKFAFYLPDGSKYVTTA